MRRAASLFTIVPVGAFLDLTRADARRAIAWFPWLGLLLGLPAGALAGVLAWWRPDLVLLAATLGVGTWVALTGAMHLDGLADTCDGLGSRRPADAALAIMKQSDIGPMGVVAIGFALLVEVFAAGSHSSPLALGAVLALAPMVGRAPVLLATTAGTPPARDSGFGALFAGVTSRSTAAITLAAVLAVCAGAGGLLGVASLTPEAVAWSAPTWLVVAPTASAMVVAAAVAIGVAHAWGRTLVRRFTGVTGDLLGAQIEVAQAVFLVVAALSLG